MATSPQSQRATSNAPASSATSTAFHGAPAVKAVDPFLPDVVGRPYIDPRRIARLQYNDEWLEAIEAHLRSGSPKIRPRHVTIGNEIDFPLARALIGILGFGTLLLGCVVWLIP